MKIAIDARWIFQEISGVGAYTRELIRHLALTDRNNTYILIFNRADLRDRTLAETGAGIHPNFATELIPYGIFSLTGQLLLPFWLARRQFDVFHSPNYMIPLLAFPRPGRRTKCVVTIHDVIPLIFPDHAPRSKKTRLFPLYRALMIAIATRVDALITVSQTSRHDVIKYLRIAAANAHKVKVVYNGVAEYFKPAPARNPKPSDAPRIVLYVGRSDPYKNLPILLRAFANAHATCAFPLTLYLVGSPDPRYPEPARLASELGLGHLVHWTGYVPDEKLVALYQQADLLVQPSRYEGFGLQVLEAMACGVPVVCTRAGALPEIAGDAAIFVPPDDVPALTHAIVNVLSDRKLANALVHKGLSQAARFTWSRTAHETLQIYEATART